VTNALTTLYFILSFAYSCNFSGQSINVFHSFEILHAVKRREVQRNEAQDELRSRAVRFCVMKGRRYVGTGIDGISIPVWVANPLYASLATTTAEEGLT
jgi:hypothetical protein